MRQKGIRFTCQRFPSGSSRSAKGPQALRKRFAKKYSNGGIYN